jgi:hypothetical protein
MKIRVLESPAYPEGTTVTANPKPVLRKIVSFWCAGCGQFHSAPLEDWNGDLDGPTLARPVESPGCTCTVRDGLVVWDVTSGHRLAARSLPLQHEEAWWDGGRNWHEVKAHEAVPA